MRNKVFKLASLCNRSKCFLIKRSQFLDIKIAKGKVNVDVYSKPTNSFTYVLPSTCYPYKKIRNVSEGISLGLQSICDTDEKHNQCPSEYQNYFIGREYNPTLVKKQYKEIRRMTRTQVRVSKQKPNHLRKTFFYQRQSRFTLHKHMKNTGNINYLQTRMVSIAFAIYIVEVERVAEKINSFITTSYFNY